MHGPPGPKNNGRHRGKNGAKVYGRSKREVRWPLMPDNLTVEQAWKWYKTRYKS